MSEDTMTVDGNSGSGNSDIHWGGDGGGNNSGKDKPTPPGVNLSKTPEAQSTAAFGAPVMIGLLDGMWGFTLFSNTTLHEAFLNGLAKLEQSALSKLEQTAFAAAPYAGRLLGITFGAFYPSEISKDDPRMMATAHIVSTLPVDKVTNTPVSSLPTQQATVVHTRITDVVEDDGKQHLAIVRDTSRPVSVPVVEAKPTQRAGVYTASVVPGKPDVHIKIAAGAAPAVSQPKSVKKEQGSSRFPGFTAGQQSHDAIVRFPGNKASPVYISITEVLPESEARKQQEEEIRRQQAWDATHPVEVAEREHIAASTAFDAADATWQGHQKRLNDLKASPEGRTLADPEKYPIKSTSNHKIYVREEMFRGQITVTTEATIDNKAKLDYLLANNGLAYKRNILKDTKEVVTEDVEGDKAIYKAEYQEYDKLRQQLLDTRNKITETETFLAAALEDRQQKEKKKQETEDNLEKESKRKQPETAKGNGEKTGERWLEDSDKDDGAPIPEEIASKLRGRTFKNFDEFRRALWEEVSKNPELAKQFTESNRKRMSQGLAPRARFKDTVGGRRSFELHHKDPIGKGGEVYDIDNIRITTPKRHIDIHKGIK